MLRMRGLATVLFGGMVVFGAVGCSDPKDMEIAALRDQIDDLSREKSDWGSRLASAMDDANAARARLAQLQGELDSCLSRLASTPPPAPPQLPREWEGDKRFAWIDVAEDILFDSGKADLKAEGRNKLQTVRDQIRKDFPTHNVWIVGHTDTDPVIHSKALWKDNLGLSLARGRVVGEALLGMGIANKDVVIGGQGQWNPKTPNDTKANKAVNRRVQIIAIQKPARTGSVDVSMRN